MKKILFGLLLVCFSLSVFAGVRKDGVSQESTGTGSVTNETDPVWQASGISNITIAAKALAEAVGVVASNNMAGAALGSTATQPGDDWTNTVAGVAAGDLTNSVLQGATAFSWGNHADAGYLTEMGDVDTSGIQRNEDRIIVIETRYAVDNALTAHLLPYGWFDVFTDTNGVNWTLSTGVAYNAAHYWEDDYSVVTNAGTGPLTTYALDDNDAGTNVTGDITMHLGGGPTTADMNVSGMFGDGFRFNGEDEQFCYTDDLGYQETNNLSANTWVSLEAAEDARVIVSFGNDYDQADNNVDIATSVAGNGYWSIWRGANDFSSTYPSTNDVGVWVMMTITYDGSNMRLYRNSTNIIDEVASIADSSGPYRLGIGTDPILTYASWSKLKGTIDNVTFYNFALTQEQIDTLWNNGAGTTTPLGGSEIVTNGAPGYLLMSTNIYAESTSTMARAVVWAKDSADFAVRVSNDGGTNWHLCNVSRDADMDIGTLTNWLAYSGETNVTTGANQTMVQRVDSTNAKVRAWSQLWE